MMVVVYVVAAAVCLFCFVYFYHRNRGLDWLEDRVIKVLLEKVKMLGMERVCVDILDQRYYLDNIPIRYFI